MVSVELDWKQGIAFDAEVDGHIIHLDASPELGGKNAGARPKKLLLAALGGCSGMDVISILKKMHIEVDSFRIDVEAVPYEEEHPHVYTSFKLTYRFTGNNLESKKDKFHKAVALSQEKYCGVAAMLGKAAQISYEIVFD